MKGKKILIGVTGGIAAYKIPFLVRSLVKQGAEVRIVMTADAEQFVTGKTLSVLSKNEVVTNFFNSSDQWNNHVELGLWPDVLLIAPATANTLAKMAHGICDSLLIATYLSSRCPVVVAPAMDEDMYLHFSTDENLKRLKEKGVFILPSPEGELASGLQGPGRMLETEDICQYLTRFTAGPFKGKKVLINAGPTYEAIDPVRFIGNRSSGKTGIYLTEAMAALGAEVTLVIGPTAERVNHIPAKIQRVETAHEMYEACSTHFNSYDIFIASAAVSDYRPENISDQKIKKSAEQVNISLIKNIDILAEAGKQKKNNQLLVGFALETENIERNAKNKLEHKNLDLIIINSPNNKGEGFGYDTNRISLLDKHNKIVTFELKQKRELAFDIAQHISTYLP
jgi:phosphopantothenoylcysteine decarboxylase / phosphopantothenate---cysteine ligase